MSYHTQCVGCLKRLDLSNPSKRTFFDRDRNGWFCSKACKGRQRVRRKVTK